MDLFDCSTLNAEYVFASAMGLSINTMKQIILFDDVKRSGIMGVAVVIVKQHTLQTDICLHDSERHISDSQLR